ncbi:hypothetical protein P7K49_020261 [Saguinus oedipus]|uniref:Uncharacterized protein n=1 Tax=Saguinus oedipus TaxID=9490 RepID=A0ABQ9V0N6_SAGOE|nr:hypothetical protein P7K49_020261 [Saguinus oedipus]
MFPAPTRLPLHTGLVFGAMVGGPSPASWTACAVLCEMDFAVLILSESSLKSVSLRSFRERASEQEANEADGICVARVDFISLRKQEKCRKLDALLRTVDSVLQLRPICLEKNGLLLWVYILPMGPDERAEANWQDST